jgi:hypothetical protein
MIKISPSNISLIGNILARKLSFLSTILILSFFGEDIYADYVKIIAIFSLLVMPVNEAYSHAITEKYPTITGFGNNIIITLTIFTVGILLYSYLEDSFSLDSQAITEHLFLLLLCCIGIIWLQERNILKMELKIKKHVFLYDIITPICFPFAFICVNLIGNIHNSLNIVALIAVLSLLSMTFIFRKPREAQKQHISLKKFFEYYVIAISTGQSTNVILIISSSYLTVSDFATLSIIIKVSTFIITPNIMQTQISIPKTKHMIITNQLGEILNCFHQLRYKSVITSMIIATIVYYFMFIVFSPQLPTLYNVNAKYIALFFMVQVMVVWVGPVSSLSIALGDSLTPAYLNIIKLVSIIFLLTQVSEIDSMLIQLTLITLAYLFALNATKYYKIKRELSNGH